VSRIELHDLSVLESMMNLSEADSVYATRWLRLTTGAAWSEQWRRRPIILLVTVRDVMKTF